MSAIRYRKRPVVIEAIRWTGDVTTELLAFMGERFGGAAQQGSLYVKTLEGTMRADVGDFIIRGVKGEVYPCKPDIFAATYEEVVDG